MGEVIPKAQTNGLAANVAVGISYPTHPNDALYVNILDVIHVSEKTFKNELTVVVGSTRKGLNCNIRSSS